MVARQKIKYSYEPPKKWLQEALDALGLDKQKFDDYVPKLSKHQSLDDVYRLACNNAAQEILVAVHLMRARAVRDLYQKLCKSSWRERNRTFMHQMIVYKICQGLGLITDRMKQNYDNAVLTGAEKVSDIFGGSQKPHKGGKGRKKKSRGETVIGTIEECIRRGNGATKDEILKTLTKRFPDRNPNSMRNTINVQLSSQMKKRFGERLQKNDNRFKIVA